VVARSSADFADTTMKDQKILRHLFPYLKRPDVEIFLDCASFIFFTVVFLHWLASF
jgi:hypothetical protein